MDPRNPVTLDCPEWHQSKGADCQHGAPIIIDGENLERERIAANSPFFATPRESALIVLVTLAALGAVLWMFCKTGGAV